MIENCILSVSCVSELVLATSCGSELHGNPDYHREFTNYRPVSLLPQFSKILEKIFNNRLDNFIESCNILSDSQYGIRSNRSTALALIDLAENLTKELDNKKITVGVFIDLKKAFDTIVSDQKVVILQKRVVRIICKCNYKAHTAPIF